MRVSTGAGTSYSPVPCIGCSLVGVGFGANAALDRPVATSADSVFRGGAAAGTGWPLSPTPSHQACARRRESASTSRPAGLESGSVAATTRPAIKRSRSGASRHVGVGRRLRRRDAADDCLLSAGKAGRTRQTRIDDIAHLSPAPRARRAVGEMRDGRRLRCRHLLPCRRVYAELARSW